MIKHIVMWTLKVEALGRNKAENAAEMKVMLEALEGKITGLLHIEVGIDVFSATPGCDVILYSELASREALAAYQVHPEHQKCVAFVREVAASRSAVDYEI